MKKAFLFFICALCWEGTQAQTSGEKVSGFISALEIRGGGPSLNKHSEFNVAEYEVTPGYGFNRHFSLFIPVTATLGLFDKDDMKSYQFAGQLGLGVGYNLLHSQKNQLEISAKAGSSIGGKWHFVYYDLGIRYGFGGYKSCRNFYLGLGVRYFDCFKGSFDDYCTLYITLGFRFNHYKLHK